MTFCIWITGLPGSGKTEIAKQLKKLFAKKKIKCEYLQLDVFRKELIPFPKYNEEERGFVYNSLILIAKFLVKNKVNVIIDSTAHRKKWREKARKNIKNFFEVYVQCNLKTCIERETKRKSNLVLRNIYKNALQRLKEKENVLEDEKRKKKFVKLGEVIGIDVPYEVGDPDIIVCSEEKSAKECAEIIFNRIKVVSRI